MERYSTPADKRALAGFLLVWSPPSALTRGAHTASRLARVVVIGRSEPHRLAVCQCRQLVIRERGVTVAGRSPVG